MELSKHRQILWLYIRNENFEFLLLLELMDIDLSMVMQSPKFDLSHDVGLGISCTNILDKLGYIVIRDITNGLRFVHGFNPEKTTHMHRDIKPSDIIID